MFAIVSMSLHLLLSLLCTPAECRIECMRLPKAPARTAEYKPKWREISDFVITCIPTS